MKTNRKNFVIIKKIKSVLEILIAGTCCDLCSNPKFGKKYEKIINKITIE